MVQKKNEFYQWLQFASLLISVPFVLALVPLSAYFVGDYVQTTFHLHKNFTLIIVIIGLIGGATEVIKIIKMAMSMEKQLSKKTE